MTQSGFEGSFEEVVASEEERGPDGLSGRVLMALAGHLVGHGHGGWVEVLELYEATGSRPGKLSTVGERERLTPLVLVPVILGWSELIYTPVEFFALLNEWLNWLANSQGNSNASRPRNPSPVLWWVLITGLASSTERLNEAGPDLHLVLPESERELAIQRVAWLKAVVSAAKSELAGAGWEIDSKGRLKARSVGPGNRKLYVNNIVERVATYLRPRFNARWPKDASTRSPQRFQRHINKLLEPIFGSVSLNRIRSVLDKIE